MSYINMKDEWKLFTGWVIIVTLLLLSDCTSAPIHNQVIRHGVIDYHELIEPLGTKHLYKTEPIVGKSYYCINHEAPEIIYEIDGTLRVRRWSGYNWGE